MPANDDQLVPNLRPRRRRLLVHAIVFAIAGLLCTLVGSPSTSAAPTVQDGRFLEGGSLDVAYTCVGADQDTTDILGGLGILSVPLAATIRSAAVEPSPSPGEDFDMAFTWDFSLNQSLVNIAVNVGVNQFDITGTETMSATSGATGPDVSGTDGPSLVPLGDGSVGVGYTHGPHTGTFNRTAVVDAPIVFTPGTITSSVLTQPLGVTLALTCDPGAETMSLLDQTGVAPTTTTTTRPPVVPTTTAGPATTVAVGGSGSGTLPPTGSSNLILVVLALGLIDIGYLAWSAGRPARRRQLPAR